MRDDETEGSAGYVSLPWVGAGGGGVIGDPEVHTGGPGGAGRYVQPDDDSAEFVPTPVDQNYQQAARLFMEELLMEPTPDAVDQMLLVFVPCLRIMCERPWDPHGGTWKKSGLFGALTDVRKKFERFWERTWIHGKRHDDSGFDLINFVGFAMRADPESRWGTWGEPGRKAES